MSRVGKKPIIIPEKTEVSLVDNKLVVKGPKGELSLTIHPSVLIDLQDKKIVVKVSNPLKRKERALWGTFRSLIFNMIEGVTKGFEKKLQLKGIGYRASLSGDKLILNVGFSHPVEFKIPEGINISVEKDIITVSGISKQLVGQVADQIRRIRKSEPYKGTGIRYLDEEIKRKVGKKAMATME